MKLTNLTPTFLLALALPITTTASPAPTPVAETPQATITPRQTRMNPGFFAWIATNWIMGCSPAFCGYGFNISAPPNYWGYSPAFDVICQPLAGQGWRDCPNRITKEDSGDSENEDDSSGMGVVDKNNRIQAYWPPEASTGTGSERVYTVRVAHLWYDREVGAWWNITGEATATQSTDTLKVMGKRIEAVVGNWGKVREPPKEDGDDEQEV